MRSLTPILIALLTMTQAISAPNQTPIYKTVEDTELRLHIFNPEGHQPSDNRPAIVFFFGGGWVAGGPGQFYPHSEYLAERGMVAISAEYRVESQHGSTPRESLQDANSAMRWVKGNAESLGIDPNEILAGGGSAGGHLAAATASTRGFDEAGDDLSIDPRPEALVLFNPVIDNGPGGYGNDRVAEYWEAFSPMHNLSDTTPPTVVFLGTEDHLIPVATAKEYKEQMEALGLRSDLHLYEGQGHGFFNLKNREYYDKTVAEMDEFLTSLGFLGKSR